MAIASGLPVTLSGQVPGSLLAQGWLPADALVSTWRQLGWPAAWQPASATMDLTVPKGVNWQRPRVPVVIALPGTRPVHLTLNGIPVGSVPGARLPNPVTRNATEYVPIASIDKMLEQIGITATWQGTRWLVQAGETTVPTAPVMPPNGIWHRTLTAVAGAKTTITEDLSATAPAHASSGAVTVTIAGRPIAVTRTTLLRTTTATDHVMRVTVTVPASLPAGYYPATFSWTLGGAKHTYQATVEVPALFIAEQDGIYEDNLLGHRVAHPGGFNQATQPADIAYDPVTQRLYVSDPNAGAIFVYTTAGVRVGTLNPPELADPTYLALDVAQQRIFVYNDGGSDPGLLCLTLSGQVVPWTHPAAFRAIFAQGSAMAYDPETHAVYITRSLTSSQAAADQPAVVAYNAVTGAREYPPGAFRGLGANPTGIVYDAQDQRLFVSGFYRPLASVHHYVVGFTGQGVRVTPLQAFPVGATNTGDANALTVDPLTGLILVVGDANLHTFTPSGQPVPPLTSRSDSATPLAALGHGGTEAVAFAY